MRTPQQPAGADDRPEDPHAALALSWEGTLVERAAVWTALAEDERRRRAVEACAAHDVDTLWRLTEAWTTLAGAAGALASPHTRKNYRHGVRVLVEAWRAENLLRPRRDAALLWLRALEEAGKKPATVAIHLAAARALYGALRWAGATVADPFHDVRPARDPTPRWEKRTPYSPEEIAALLELATAEERVLILLAAHGGLRVSECLALQWADVALPRRELVVRSGKGGRQRTVPLSTSLRAALRTYAREGGPAEPAGYVLPYRSDFPARGRLKALAQRADVPYRGIHALRHACGTRLVAENGGDLEAAARLLGHSSIETTRIYSKWSDQTLRTTVDRW